MINASYGGKKEKEHNKIGFSTFKFPGCTKHIL